LLGGQGGGCASSGDDDINLERNQFGRKRREPLGLPLGISVFNHDVAALDVTEVTQSLTESLVQMGVRSQVERQEAYSRDLPRLLGIGGERRCEETEGKGDDELATLHHWMISSARSRSDGGIVSPRALAVLRLI
jgi:hypothetical protein